MATYGENRKPDTSDKKNEIFDRVGKRINQWNEHYADNQERFRNDKEFLFLDQWDDTEKQEFKRTFKPIMQFNMLHDYYRKVVGQQRNSCPNLMVRRVDDNFKGNPQVQNQIQEQIDLRTDIIRDIAYNSRSQIAYETAFANALAGGFGAIRVIHEYKDAYSFDQHVLIKPVENPERCFFDPNATESTKHDGDYCGYYISMGRAEFNKTYPKIENPVSYPVDRDLRNFTWGDKDTVTIVEYYEKEYFSFRLFFLDNGETVTEKQYKKLEKKYLEDMVKVEAGVLDPMVVEPLPNIQEGGERTSKDYTIKYYKLIADTVLEKGKCPSKELPIIFTPGELENIQGKEYTISFVRYVKDAQRFLNYTKCEIAQAIKNGRREQWVGTPDNIATKALQKLWKNPDIQQGMLLAMPDPTTGKLPTRVPASEVPQTLMLQAKSAQEDIASILGLYEANRGQDGSERSGRAVRERQRTGNQGLVVFFDNLDRAVEQTGRVVLSMLPKIYDTERKLMLDKADGTSYDTVINKKLPDGSLQNSMKEGKYSLEVEAGPSFAAQRDDALNILMKFAQNPQVFPLIADLVAENVDIENRTQLVERLKNLVPKAILAQEQGESIPPSPPSPQEQNAKAQLELEQEKLRLEGEEIQLKKLQQQVETEKVLIQAQDQKRKNYIAGVRSEAETHKADLEYRASVADTLARVQQSLSDIRRAQNEMR